jgi:hypothetical protein
MSLSGGSTYILIVSKVPRYPGPWEASLSYVLISMGGRINGYEPLETLYD